MGLIGDFHQGDVHPQRLNGNVHVIIPHPEIEHRDCIVCCKRNVAGGRRETAYVCEMCDFRPGLYLGTQ
jgi:hypothetical protein